MLNKKTKSGFTLIELLVVIAIIGILASVTISSLNKARARAQAAKIVSTFKAVEMALIMTGDELGWSKWPDHRGEPLKVDYVYDPANPSIPLYYESSNYASMMDDLPGFSDNMSLARGDLASGDSGENFLYRCNAAIGIGSVLQFAKHDSEDIIAISEYVDQLMDDGNGSTGKIIWANYPGDATRSSSITYRLDVNPLGFDSCNS